MFRGCESTLQQENLLQVAVKRLSVHAKGVFNIFVGVAFPAGRKPWGLEAATGGTIGFTDRAFALSYELSEPLFALCE